MDSNRGQYTVEMMAKVLNVCPRSYYNYKKGMNNIREIRKEKLMQKITDIYFDKKGRYGAPRIVAELNANNTAICLSTVAKYMRELGIRSKLGRKFRIATTDSNHGFYIAPNLLNREFDVDKPSKVWVSDITYIHTKDGFLYLTVVIDLYDRKVIGWSYSSDMTAQNTTVAALRMAVRNRKPNIGTIIHSDRGVQYACGEFVDLIKENKMVQSMSRKGNCWDNAVAESFFKSLKTELIYGAIEMSAKDMETELFEYIEVWYNRSRRHSALGNQTITEFWNDIFCINKKVA
ncbi:MAG: IS3 family transposase [Rikenellaceae bacterium]